MATDGEVAKLKKEISKLKREITKLKIIQELSVKNNQKSPELDSKNSQLSLQLTKENNRWNKIMALAAVISGFSTFAILLVNIFKK